MLQLTVYKMPEPITVTDRPEQELDFNLGSASLRELTHCCRFNMRRAKI